MDLIQEHIERFARRYAHFKHPNRAKAQCVGNSLEFLNMVYEDLSRCGFILGVDYGVLVDSTAPNWHQTFFFEGNKIDFTYRQFDPLSEFPRITPVIEKDLESEAWWSEFFDMRTLKDFIQTYS